MSTDKLEASLVWAREKYGDASPLVRSLTKQLEIRKQETAAAAGLDELVGEIRAEESEVSSKAAIKIPAFEAAISEQDAPPVDTTELDTLAASLSIDRADEGELPRFQIGERLGRKYR